MTRSGLPGQVRFVTLVAMDVTVRHTLPISPAGYWETLYGCRPFIEALYTEGLGGTELRISEWHSHDDGGFERTLSFNPRMQAPSAVKKILGDAFRCEERGSFDPAHQRWRFDYLSSSLTDKIRIQGTQYASEHPEGCELVCTLSVTVGIFGVGRLVEKTITAQFEADMRTQAAFIRRWLSAATTP